jgi:predicted GIY-YIG superfamily endonuclease
LAYFVYILLCNDGSFYTGFTKDVEKRAKLHINGKGARYTKAHPPQKVVHIEEFTTRSEAMRRERAIKKLSHKQKIKIINSCKQPKTSGIEEAKISKEHAGIENTVKSLPKPKPTFTQKLHDSKNLPKVEPIDERMSKRWGKGTLVIPAPIEVDELMAKVPPGKVTTINEIRAALAKRHDATIGCPMTTGIFAWIAAQAVEERRQQGEKELRHTGVP